MEAHPEVAYEADKQYRIWVLLEDEPCLADFFRNYRKGRVNARTGGERELAERKRMKKCYGKPPPKTCDLHVLLLQPLMEF